MAFPVRALALCAALLLPGLVGLASLAGLPSLAGAAELKLATWDIDWLTVRPAGDRALPADVTVRQPADLAKLRDYAAVLDADVVALQGVDGADAAALVFPADRYAVHVTADAVLLRTGFAVRRGIAFTANPDVTALADPEGAHHARSGADITLDLKGGKLRLLSVHLQAGCRYAALTAVDRPGCAVLAAQLPVLAQWIADRRTEGVAFAVLGNFNRRMDGRDPFLAGLQHGVALARATDARSNPCWGGAAFVDHILAGGPARDWLRPATLKVLVYRETDPAAKPLLSSHCPVSVRLAVPEQHAGP